MSKHKNPKNKSQRMRCPYCGSPVVLRSADGNYLANHELRTLRRTAHYYFDQLYKTGRMTRQESYRWLVDKICVPLKDAHIGHLGEYYCKLVIQDSRRLLRAWHGSGEMRVS